MRRVKFRLEYRENSHIAFGGIGRDLQEEYKRNPAGNAGNGWVVYRYAELEMENGFNTLEEGLATVKRWWPDISWRGYLV